jgi:excisionase family DNA binding protein
MAVDLQYLTPAEAALISRLSRKTIYRAIRSGGLCASRPTGTRYLIEMAEFIRWVSTGGDTAVPSDSASGLPRPLVPAEVGSLERLRALEADAA